MSYSLKVIFNGDIRRVRLETLSLNTVRISVNQIFAKSLQGDDFQLSYLDEEGDVILVDHDCELTEAVGENGDLRLFVNKLSTPFVPPTKSESEKTTIRVESEPKLPKVVPEKPVEIVTEPVAPQTIAEPVHEQPEKTVKDEKEEVVKVLLGDEEKPDTIPLSDIVDEETFHHPFFVELKEDFLKFSRNVRASIPPDFPEQLGTQFETTFHQVQESVEIFVNDLDNYRRVRVPEVWESNPLVIQMKKSITEGNEKMNARLERWAAAKVKLEEMGFTDYGFVQRMLIIQHDGNTEEVVNDLLVRSGQVAEINSKFGKFSDFLLQLFSSFATQLKTHGHHAIEAGGQGFKELGNQVNVGLRSGAQYVQGQVSANKETIQSIQSELDNTISAVHGQVAKMNSGGEQFATNVNTGFHNVFAHSQERVQQLQEQGAKFSCGTLGLLSDSIRTLGSIFARASHQIQPRPVTLGSCGNCRNTIFGPLYVCGQCNNAALCETCEVTHDPTHVLVKVRVPQEVHGHPYLTGSCVQLINSRISSQSAIQMDEIQQADPSEEQQPKLEQPQPEVEQPPVEAPVEAPVPLVMQEEDPQEAVMRPLLASLNEMGFNDNARLRALLIQHQFDLEAVVQILLS
jgi:hypothetical protein